MLIAFAAAAAVVRFYDTGTRRAQLVAGKGPHLHLIGGRASRPSLGSHLAVIFVAALAAAFVVVWVAATIVARVRGRRRVMRPGPPPAMRGLGDYGGGEW